MNIGDRIKSLRKNNGLTQSDLANMIEKSTITIRKYESGDITPPLDVLNNIAQALGVTINDLVGNKRTLAQSVINDLLSEGKTLEKLATESQVPLSELTAMYQNQTGATMGSFFKLGKYLNLTDEEIMQWIFSDGFTNSIYNNADNDPELSKLKNFFLEESTSNNDENINKSYEVLADSTNFNHQLFRERIGISLEKMATILNVNKYELEKIEKKESNNKKLIVNYKIYLSEIYDLKEFIQREVNQAIFSDNSKVDILKLTHLTTYQRLELLDNLICYLNKTLSNFKNNSDNNK